MKMFNKSNLKKDYAGKKNIVNLVVLFTMQIRGLRKTMIQERF
jgi:hypothetical protein